MRKSILIKVFTLISSSILIKALGFVFRIYISKEAGACGCGLYHLVLSVYALCASISSFGINQTLSRLVSYNEKNSIKILRTALIITGAVSLTVFLIVYNSSEYIALNILKDSRVINSVKIVSFSFPAISVFASISGYFNGLTKVKYSANGQVVEQITRIIFVFAFLSKAMKYGIEQGIIVLSIGIVLGEYISALYIYLSYKIYTKNKKDAYTNKSFVKGILKISIPTASGGYISSFIHTLENILLPQKLMLWGMTNNESISALGIIKGMATPILFFPAIVVNAISVLVLPKISKEQSIKNYKSIKDITTKSLFISFGAGVISTFVFSLYADKITFLIYDNYDASIYVRALGLALPFLFFNITSCGILNGLGKQMLTMCGNVFSSLIKLVSVIALVPSFSIYGYFFGFIASEILGFIGYFILIYSTIFKKNRI